MLVHKELFWWRMGTWYKYLKLKSINDFNEDIIIRKEDAEGMKIVGEFVKILN